MRAIIRYVFRLFRQHWKLTLGAVVVLLLVGVILIVAGATVWEYTNSTVFCGTTCHTMPPEYAAYKQSPHARVACVDCHLGQESFLAAVPRKAKELRHVYYALSQDYETPIYVKNMRPARETCEKCHNPAKFSADSLKKIVHYLPDPENTPRETFLTLKTGGGTLREGLGRGIHWHIESQVYYLSEDKLHQNIPYVKEVRPDGTVIEYYDLDSGVTPADVAARSAEVRRMDCIDCHNRISHTFQIPQDAVDEAISRNRIDGSLPYIAVKATQLLSGQAGSREESMVEIARLEDWYRLNYPAVYATKKASVQQAVTELQAIFERTYFPDMSIGWSTHPDNLGHKNFPGCFRCHDGKHVSSDGQTIRLECNICHTIPRVTGPGLPAPVIAVEPQNEPESHQDSNWLARHRNEFDITCTGCHSTYNRGGSDNSSFCANSACHGVEWKWAGLDAPGLRAYLPQIPAGEQPPASSEPGTSSFVPRIPHPLTEDRIGQCLTCHGLEGLAPYTPFHVEEGFPLDACTECHELAPGVQ
ncbi:MAG: cytochrome C [Chloroflexi bacterium]|nr:cytochrome C [Chloroflexota bacterium]